MLNFRISGNLSVLPLLLFVLSSATLSLFGAASINGFLLCAMMGIVVGMFFSKDFNEYNKTIFNGMADTMGTTAMFCWMYAGLYGALLKSSGLVEALVWVGKISNIHSSAFVVLIFFLAAAYSSATGTSLGTIIALTPIFYPAGVILGGKPAAVLGAVMSGAIFGDNIAPISDTTIISALSQDSDIGGVVKSRMKYALIAMALSALFFFIFGRGNALSSQYSMNDYSDPSALPMLISPLIVIITAMMSRNFVLSLTMGLTSGICIGYFVFPLKDFISLTPSGLGGSAIGGVIGILPIAILTLLVLGMAELMKESGTMDRIITFLREKIATTVTRAELAIVAIVNFLCLLFSINTIGEIVSAPLVSEIGSAYNLNGYRRANLLDASSCSVHRLVPWASTMLAILAGAEESARTFAFLPAVQWTEIAVHTFHPIFLFVVILIACITGFGREYG
jgi:Na+/H+ antiporter NhaC